MANSINFDKTFSYSGENTKYIVQLERHKFPWWIFLLLLPLLLLIKCNKTISVNCFESSNLIPIAGQEVDMQYVPHFVFNDGKFFPSDTLKLTKITDSTGFAVFDSLPCSVFSYVFYCLQEADFSAVSQCYAAIGVKKNFHFTSHVDLGMQPRREDLHVKLIDKETGDIIIKLVNAIPNDNTFNINMGDLTGYSNKATVTYIQGGINDRNINAPEKTYVSIDRKFCYKLQKYSMAVIRITKAI